MVHDVLLTCGSPVVPCAQQIRFARFGRKYRPFYRLVAIDSRARRDGRPLEVCFLVGCCTLVVAHLMTRAALYTYTHTHVSTQYLGWYNPLNKETSLNAPRIQHWLQVWDCGGWIHTQTHTQTHTHTHTPSHTIYTQVGAEPSDTVNNLLKKAMVIEEAA